MTVKELRERLTVGTKLIKTKRWHNPDPCSLPFEVVGLTSDGEAVLLKSSVPDSGANAYISLVDTEVRPTPTGFSTREWVSGRLIVETFDWVDPEGQATP